MKTVVVSFLALTLALGSFCLAADRPIKTNNPNMPTQEVMKVSQDGFAAMRSVRAARVAIFNGKPEVASDMLNKAKNDLQTAYNDASTFFKNTKFATKGKIAGNNPKNKQMDWIPIDGQVALAETYIPSREKAEHINKANKFFKEGESKKAIEELRLGEIDVTYTCVLMPWKATMKCVTEACKLAEEHKYYEANLALKTAEDGLIIDSVSLMDAPIKNHPQQRHYQQNQQKNQPKW